MGICRYGFRGCGLGTSLALYGNDYLCWWCFADRNVSRSIQVPEGEEADAGLIKKGT